MPVVLKELHPNRSLADFKGKLETVLQACSPAPTTVFCIAIEEMEAWLLGDRDAVVAAYPRAKQRVLAAYQSDAICGTWEVLADAIHSGGAKSLKKSGWPAPGVAKCEWAKQIAPRMNVDANTSPSFQHFRDELRLLAPEP